ncbi:MAG: hypothetical protein ACI4VU_08075 [Methanobrevibacter sp.]
MTIQSHIIENGTNYYKITVINQSNNKIVTPSQSVNSTNNTKNVTINGHKGVLITGKTGQTFNYKEGQDQIVIMTTNMGEKAFKDVIRG